MCHEASQSAFLYTQLYLSTNLDHILYKTFLGTNSLSVLMCRKTVNQSINQSINQSDKLKLSKCHQLNEKDLICS